jgi:ribosome-associated protein
MSSGTHTTEQNTARRFAIEAAQLISDRHCDDVVVLDVTGLSQVCDFVIVATGTSDRQMKAVASELDDLAAEFGHKRFRSSSDSATTWIVVDFVDLVVHLFEPNQRDYYDLEALWSDAPRIEWKR